MAGNFPPADDRQAEREARRAANAAKGSPITRFRNWLIDSYNGIFKIVVQPQLPSLRTLIFLAVAFIVGMAWAYLIAPPVFYNAAPFQLSLDQRDQYVKLVAGAYEAGLYAEDQIITLLQRVEDPAEAVRRLIPQETGQVQFALEQIQPLAEQAGPGTPAPVPGNIISDILSIVAAIFIFIVIVLVISLLWGLLIGGFVERFAARFRPETDADRAAKAAIEDIRRRKALEVQMKAESAADVSISTLGPPIMQRISTYTPGRAFDDSFAIEDANDNFLGECGATIARTIGEGQELAAVEIWLFDKEDFVRTLTKIFVSEHGFNDPVIRSELEPKVDDPVNDIVMVTPGATLIVETGSIRLQARIADVQYGTGPLPPRSYFDSLTIQMQAWELAGSPAPAAAPTPAAAGGLPDLSSYEIGPPPTMPTGMSQPQAAPPPTPTYSPPPQQPPSYPPAATQPNPTFQPPPGGGLRPLSPPPMQPPQGAPGQFSPFGDDDEEEDDPFGGTGDFTPIGR